jgi:hypothetical protein
MTAMLAMRSGIFSTTLLSVCALAASGTDNNAGHSAPALDKPPHPLLAPLIPQLTSGFYSPNGSTTTGDDQLPPSTDPHDFAGRYAPLEATHLLPGERGRMASYTDRGARVFMERAQQRINGGELVDAATHCKPEGTVRALNQGSTVQVLQSATQLTLIHMTNHLVRRIAIGGQPGPSAMRPSSVGTSIGHWEGNTLVVETRGFQDDLWLDDYGDPGSEHMMLTERFTKQPNGSLRIEATLNDPVNYVGPIRMVRNWGWAPTARWIESICMTEHGKTAGGKP